MKPIESRTLKGYILAALSAASYGLIPLFILPVKQAHFSLDTTLFYRFFIAALIVLFILLFQKGKLKVSIREAGILIGLGLFYGLSSDFLFKGYDYLGAGVASTIFFIYPVIVALLMTVFFKEKMSLPAAGTLIVCFIGVYLMGINQSAFNVEIKGLIITLSSALFYGLYLILVRKGRFHANAWTLTFYSMLFTSFYYLIKMIWHRQPLLLPDFELFLNFTVFALVTTVLSLVALIYAVKYIGPTPTAILGVFEPLVAVAISVLFFGESVTAYLIFGGLLILLGVGGNVLIASKKEHSKKAAEVIEQSKN